MREAVDRAACLSRPVRYAIDRSNGKCYRLSSGGMEGSLQAISAYLLND